MSVDVYNVLSIVLLWIAFRLLCDQSLLKCFLVVDLFLKRSLFAQTNLNFMGASVSLYMHKAHMVVWGCSACNVVDVYSKHCKFQGK
jgi:hypothetical protein